jgi:trehalose 6-phosphate phosphatase
MVVANAQSARMPERLDYSVQGSAAESRGSFGVTRAPRAPLQSPPGARLQLGACALFLDLDGTLIEIAPRPSEARGDRELVALLSELSRCSGGALALVTGRSIADLDSLVAPGRFAASGLHGFERRNAAGMYTHLPPPRSATFEAVRRVMVELTSAHPQLLLEDKGFALALHYRQAGHLQRVITSAVEAVPDLEVNGLRVQHGDMVVEVTPNAADKATALAAFMREPPFSGRAPLYVGDDLTDECAFQWVNRSGGLSVAVNARASSAARASLASVIEVRRWLHALVASAMCGDPR